MSKRNRPPIEHLKVKDKNDRIKIARKTKAKVGSDRMKKLFVIIVGLVIIFIGMIVYKNVVVNNKNVGISEIEKIEKCIDQVYMWKEVTGEALPQFESINDADDRWVWEVVKKNLEEDKPSYEQLQGKAKEIFGENFAKSFPKEGTQYLSYDEESNLYNPIDVVLDDQSDLFLLNKIEKTKNGYVVEIVEYLEDYSPMLKEEAEDYIVIKNLNGEEIGRASGSIEDEETNLVKRNIDRFSIKKVVLREENEKLYVERVYK